MNREKPDYKIIASTLEDFKSIEERILQLPTEVLDQIENAEFGICGLHCTFKKIHGDSIKVALPEFATQISDFGDDIRCYADRFHFIIPKYDLSKVKITYYFTNRSNTKKDLLIKEIRAEIKNLIPNGTLKNDAKENGSTEEKIAATLSDLIAKIEKI